MSAEEWKKLKEKYYQLDDTFNAKNNHLSYKIFPFVDKLVEKTDKWDWWVKEHPLLSDFHKVVEENKQLKQEIVELKHAVALLQTYEANRKLEAIKPDVELLFNSYASSTETVKITERILEVLDDA